jgi:hypothetical protein
MNPLALYVALFNWRPLKCTQFSTQSSGRGGTRTHTPLTEQGILSPLCLPFHHAANHYFRSIFRLTALPF